jgi:hypothetical protein
MTPGDLHDGAGIILLPLTFAAGNWLDPTIDSCAQAPQQVNCLAVIRSVKPGRHHEHIDVAPGVDLPCDLRPEHHPEAHSYAVLLQSLQVILDHCHN